MNNIGPVLALSIAATCCLPASAQQLDVARFLKERGAESAELRQLARSPSPAVVPVATSYISMFRSDAGKQLVAIASIANDGTLKVEKTCRRHQRRRRNRRYQGAQDRAVATPGRHPQSTNPTMTLF